MRKLRLGKSKTGNNNNNNNSSHSHSRSENTSKGKVAIDNANGIDNQRSLVELPNPATKKKKIGKLELKV